MLQVNVLVNTFQIASELVNSLVSVVPVAGKLQDLTAPHTVITSGQRMARTRGAALYNKRSSSSIFKMRSLALAWHLRSFLTRWNTFDRKHQAMDLNQTVFRSSSPCLIL